MNDPAQQHIRALCEQLEVENDLDRFAELIHEINLLLERAEKRLAESSDKKPDS